MRKQITLTYFLFAACFFPVSSWAQDLVEAKPIPIKEISLPEHRNINSYYIIDDCSSCYPTYCTNDGLICFVNLSGVPAGYIVDNIEEISIYPGGLPAKYENYETLK